MAKLIVGLGNPGRKYEKTRHNVGFSFLDFIANEINENYKFSSKFNADIIETRISDEKVFFAKPQTFMNLSGNFVSRFLKMNNLKSKDVIVVYDDINFSIADYRYKNKGSHGGHNGMRDIIEKIKTDEISRIKIGVGSPDKTLSNFVLSNFSKSDIEKVSDNYETYYNIILHFIKEDDYNFIKNKFSNKI